MDRLDIQSCNQLVVHSDDDDRARMLPAGPAFGMQLVLMEATQDCFNARVITRLHRCASVFIGG
jgi:hypothetical protein